MKLLVMKIENTIASFKETREHKLLINDLLSDPAKLVLLVSK